MDNEPAPLEIEDGTKQTYPYLSIDVNRNSRGWTFGAAARTRPGESDQETLQRLRDIVDQLQLAYPPDRN